MKHCCIITDVKNFDIFAFLNLVLTTSDHVRKYSRHVTGRTLLTILTAMLVLLALKYGTLCIPLCDFVAISKVRLDDKKTLFHVKIK